ncbi:MAG: hypothetical protein V7607_4634, partial [Solirubrobacteraceae bacterium]
MTHGGPRKASPDAERGPAVTEPTQVRRRVRRFGPLGLAVAGAGGFLAGVLLVAILGGAQPVYK